ncbi:MAG TPA: hypothetical protein VFZ25_10165 [Chloroflexota bacterium]|nr:hypothetical protein [Chloroflexota bacterium]
MNKLLPALLAAGLFALAVVPGARPAFAAGTETIEGSVVAATKGVTLPDGLTATLDGVRDGHQFVAEQTTPVDATGHFRFAGVPDDATYVVTITVGGAPYTAMVGKPNAQGVASTQLNVYGSTTNDSQIQVTTANWVVGAVDLPNQQITVLETLEVTNRGDTTYVGDHKGDPGSDLPGVLPRTLRLPLPDGASAFHPEQGFEGSNLLPVSGGWVDTVPITPGTHAYAYSYQIAFADGGAELRKTVPYPIGKLRVLVPNVGLELRSDHLQGTGTIDIEGRSYVVLEADNLAANTTVTIDMLGLPTSPVGRIDPSAMRDAGFLAIALALAVALYFGLRPRRSTNAPDAAAERQALLRALARIDERYAAGQIDAERYQAERAQRKRELIDLLMGGRSTADGTGAA